MTSSDVLTALMAVTALALAVNIVLLLRQRPCACPPCECRTRHGRRPFRKRPMTPTAEPEEQAAAPAPAQAQAQVIEPPVVGASAAPPRPPVPLVCAAAPRSDAEAFGRPRVLLVDREPGARSPAMRALAGAGYEVLRAADAAECLALFEGTGPRPRLVVSDAFPTGLTGAALAERLRARDPELPVVLLSAFPPEAVQAPPGVTVLSVSDCRERLLAATEDALGAGRA